LFTWSSLEPDKCASIWLIRRFIAPDARILIVTFVLVYPQVRVST